MEQDDIKYMDVKEFREMGLLLEVNRTFFHPLGLALEVAIDEDGTETVGRIWDYRNDEEGILCSKIDKEKLNKAQEFIKDKHQKRQEILGFIYQEEWSLWKDK